MPRLKKTREQIVDSILWGEPGSRLTIMDAKKQIPWMSVTTLRRRRECPQNMTLAELAAITKLRGLTGEQLKTLMENVKR